MEILTLEDFKDTKLDPTWGHFDYLLEIARIDQKKLEKPSIKARNGGEEKENRPWHDDQGFLKYFLYNTAPAQPQALMFNQDQNYMGFKKQKSLKRYFKTNEEDKKSYLKSFLQYFAPQSEAMFKEENAGSKKQPKNENAGLKKKRKLSDEDEEWRQIRPKSKKSMKKRPESQVQVQVQVPVHVPDMSENFKKHIFEKMGGSELGLVIQKTILFSDINPQASRLTMPLLQLKSHEFLTEEEAENLKNGKTTLRVRLLDPSMKEREINFGRWNLTTSSSYIFKTEWNSLVKDIGLKVDDILQVWSFRAKSDLCFALVKLPRWNIEQGSS